MDSATFWEIVMVCSAFLLICISVIVGFIVGIFGFYAVKHMKCQVRAHESKNDDIL